MDRDILSRSRLNSGGSPKKVTLDEYYSLIKIHMSKITQYILLRVKARESFSVSLDLDGYLCHDNFGDYGVNLIRRYLFRMSRLSSLSEHRGYMVIHHIDDGVYSWDYHG